MDKQHIHCAHRVTVAHIQVLRCCRCEAEVGSTIPPSIGWLLATEQNDDTRLPQGAQQ